MMVKVVVCSKVVVDKGYWWSRLNVFRSLDLKIEPLTLRFNILTYGGGVQNVATVVTTVRN